MAIITLPTIHAQSISMELLRADDALEFFNGGEVIIQGTKAIWTIGFPLAPQKIETARIWRARLSQLSKLANTFLITPPDNPGPSNGYAGTEPLVKGASQLGLQLVCDVVSTASETIALEGDYLECNGEFKILTADAVTASGGSPNQVTFNVEPAWRNSPADNAAVRILAPRLEVRLATPSVGWTVGASGFYEFNLQAIESFGP